MKNFLSFRAVWLVVVSMFLVIACTSRWQRQGTPKNKNYSYQIGEMPVDSLVLKRENDKYGGYSTIFFDTTKLIYFPDLNPTTLVTLPKYKALFGLTDEYDLVKDQAGNNCIAYQKIPFHGISYSYQISRNTNKLYWGRAAKFIPLHKPEEIKISMDSALQIALQQDYPTRKQQYQKRLIDSFGYIPAKYEKLVYEAPISPERLKDYIPDAKFEWQKKKPTAFDSLSYPKGELKYIQIVSDKPILNDSIPLCYTFNIRTLRRVHFVVIDAITGEVKSNGPIDSYFACEPNIPLANHNIDHLWYYNPDGQNIAISTCQYGNNTCDVLRLSNDKLNAYCRSGTFNDPPPVFKKNFIDWSQDNAHFSPHIDVQIANIPSAINSLDGSSTLSFTPADGGEDTYSFSGNQILTTADGFAAHAIPTTEAAISLSGLSAGIYELTITNQQNCNSVEYVAIGCQNGPSVMATTTAANCYNSAGDITVSISNVGSFNGQNPQIAIKGPVSTNGFVSLTDFQIADNSFVFAVSQFNDLPNNTQANLPLSPGNYAILVKNPANNKVGQANVRIDYPDCETERKILQSAYWAIDRTHRFFNGQTLTPIAATQNYNTWNIGLPTNIFADGYCQFAKSTKPIAISLVEDSQANALFETSSINDSEYRIKITKGTNANSPIIALDIMAHEYAHGINAKGMQVSGNPNVFSESEAINEGFSDIMGCIVEATSESNVDWVAGDALNDAVYATKRNMADPTSQGLPNVYNNPLYNSPELETELTFGINYIRSMIFSHWFYLLAQENTPSISANGVTISSIGMEKAAKITLAVFVSNAYGLDNSSNKNYAGLCAATLKAANDLYPATNGVCSPELQAVKKAWQAVGVTCPLPTGITCDLCLPTNPDTDLCDNHLPYIMEASMTENGNISYQNAWITLFKNDVGSTQIQPLTPNPSSETSYLHYEIAEQTTAVFELYDLTGRLLLQQTLRGKGTYSLSAANYSSGMYLYRISIAGKSMYQNKWLITK